LRPLASLREAGRMDRAGPRIPQRLLRGRPGSLAVFAVFPEKNSGGMAVSRGIPHLAEIQAAE
jgi:hypothetical protein